MRRRGGVVHSRGGREGTVQCGPFRRNLHSGVDWAPAPSSDGTTSDQACRLAVGVSAVANPKRKAGTNEGSVYAGRSREKGLTGKSVDPSIFSSDMIRPSRPA